MDTHEERFHRLLALLSSRSHAEMDEIEVEIYDRILSPHGYERVNKAIEALIIERGPTDSFPSAGMILARLGVAPASPRAIAMDVTNRIITAIGRKGYNWSQKVPDFQADMLRVLGHDGVAAVRSLGGWEAVCELDKRDPQRLRTWIRDSAAAVLEIQGPAPMALEHKKSR